MAQEGTEKPNLYHLKEKTMIGRMISLEGPEGGGKTTLAKKLVTRLVEEGFDALYVREPGGTEIGEKIREVLLTPSKEAMSSVTEALLYSASRAELVEKTIIPHLKAGKILIMDRYVDSSIAYQSGARGLPEAFVREINHFAPIPSLTFLIDIAVEEGLHRKKNQQEQNRLDLEEVSFHEKVRESYLALSKKEERFVLLEGLEDQDKNICKMLQKIKEVL